MRLACWLIVSSSGTVNIRKGKPDTRANEVAVQLDINIPDALFERPFLQASIDVPEENYISNPISTEVINEVRDEIENRTGLNFDVRLIHSHDDE